MKIKAGGKSGTLWTGAEMNFLKNNIDQKDGYLSQRLGRSEQAVRSMKYKIMRGYEVSDDDYVQPGLLMTHDEKVSRIYRMAADMRIRLQK